jgi:hypothetical protein
MSFISSVQALEIDKNVGNVMVVFARHIVMTVQYFLFHLNIIL